MAKYRRRPTEIEAITFQELVRHGKKVSGNIVNGMPWSFKYRGHAVTHENDTCYIVPTKTGDQKFTHKDMLMIRPDEIYPCPIDVFKETYEPI